MKRVLYNSTDALITDAVGLLTTAMTTPPEGNSLIMVTGGRTPAPVYAGIASQAPSVPAGVMLTLSDERYVPVDDERSNARLLGPLIEACHIPPAQLLLPRMDYSYARSVFDFDTRLGAFFDAGGTFPLAILGLGADGHLAGLFSAEQVADGLTGWAQGVERADGLDGITVSARCLLRAEKVVFWVSGKDKADAVGCLFEAPESIPAGIVLARHDNVEVWWADV